MGPAETSNKAEGVQSNTRTEGLCFKGWNEVNRGGIRSTPERAQDKAIHQQVARLSGSWQPPPGCLYLTSMGGCKQPPGDTP